MAQTFEQLQDGVTKFRYLYNLIQSNFSTIKSQFSGTTAPVSPVAGQCWFNTTDQNLYQYKVDPLTGAGYWDNTSPTELQEEMELARGTAATLDARLSIGINDDGTFKESIPVTANTWVNEENVITYLTSSTFKIAGDVRAVYVSDRAISLTQNISAIMYVDTTTLSGADTIISIKGGTVDTGLSAVAYSTLVKENQPYIDIDTSDKANVDLSNLSTTGQAVIDGKANVDLDNLSTTGQAVIDGKANTNLSNITSTGKNNIIDMILPNRAAGVAISGNSYKTLKTGWIYMYVITGGYQWAYGKATVDGIDYSPQNGDGGAYAGRGGSIEFFVKKGKTITFTSSGLTTFTKTFFPCEGAS